MNGGYKCGSVKPDVIRDLFGKWPDSNIGVVTGRRSRIVVVDIANKNGGEFRLRELERMLGDLPTTVIVETGGGRHFYFLLSDAWLTGNRKTVPWEGRTSNSS